MTSTPHDALPSVHLRPGRERPVLQGHPWLLSGAIASVHGEPEPGATVDVLDARGARLGRGDFDPDSQIRVRLTTVGTRAEEPEEEWFCTRLARAIAWRTDHPLLQNTTALRLVHAESDGLPGLTLDRYGEHAVLRPSTPAMLRRVERYAERIAELCGCTSGWLRGDLGRAFSARALFGSVPEEPVEIEEHGRRYWVDLRRGQKTGFYLDQRDSRSLFAQLAPGQRALDLFAYSGGFAHAALAGGAAEVTAVDSSAGACALARRNAPGAQVVEADVGEYLRAAEPGFGLIALDPPPLAKRSRDVPAASRAYKDLNLWALRRLTSSGHLLTFSCSHHLSPELFEKIVCGAARDANRSAQILARLSAPPDHPVSTAHPQSAYLCGLLLRAE